ncbi:MAG: MBL fold metallo-hydrolase [Candidatus Omnitrophota bacterium]
MSYILESIVVGLMEVNCYIFADKQTNDAVIIDPGADSRNIQNSLRKIGAVPRFIINTHGHGDHIGANGALDLPIMIHTLDADYLSDPKRNLSASFFLNVTSPKASKLLNDKDKIKLGALELEVIHTPGHTPGSICLKSGDILFTGDTLFYEAVGRTDIPGGSEKELLRSIKEKILTLDDNIKVYPGHGSPSTIGHERKNNPFL